MSTARALPGAGNFQASAYRTVSTDTSEGSNSHNTSDDINTSVTEHVWRLPITTTVDYNDNVYASLLQQLNGSGQTVLVTDNSPTTRILLTTVGTSYRFPYAIFVSGFVTRQEEYQLGQSFGATQVGGNVTYNFGRWFKGLSVMVGANDSASQNGNQGAGMVATATYLHRFGKWETTSNVSYNQNVQTMLALYTQSGCLMGRASGGN